MIFGMIVGTGLSDEAGALVHFGEHARIPSRCSPAVYSAVLGLFVPSGGSKWVIEAPYVLQAAMAHQVHLGLGGADLQRWRRRCRI